MGDWNEVLETCFVHDQYGDVYQLSPLSILFNSKNYKQSLNEMLNGIDNNNYYKNVFLLHIHKLLTSLQSINDTNNNDIDDDNKQYENLWNIWIDQVKTL